MPAQLPIAGLAPAVPRSRTPYLVATATISYDRWYRYALRRVWDWGKPQALFCSLNPSMADGEVDDPTLRRDVAFAQAWGYGGLWLGNLYGYRCTDPRLLKATADPIGPDTDLFLDSMLAGTTLTVAAWGSCSFAKGRAEAVLARLASVRPVYCLGTTRDGSPLHPLYLRKTARPMVYRHASPAAMWSGDAITGDGYLVLPNERQGP